MTSCRAVMASVAMADTRAWSTVAALRSFWAKRSVALRPEPAAVGLGTVAVMVVLLCRCGRGVVRRRPPCRAPPRACEWWGAGRSLPVLPVAGELVGVDLDADPGSWTDGE